MSSNKNFEIQNLSVGYNNTAVLDSVNFNLAKGDFVSLLGPNGAGKTTLLKTLARLLAPVKGSIILNNKNLNDFRQEELAKITAVVLTHDVSPGLFNVFEFVSQVRYPHTDFFGRLKKKDVDAVNKALSMVNAEEFVHRQLSTLSDGERQKVYLARALAQEPEIIILDEPTLYLDLKHRMEVMSILQRMCMEKGITVLASMHDVDIAAKVSDCVGLVKEGKIAAWGPPEEILTEETVSSLYEFDGAGFNQELGSIEIKANGGNGKVFVAAGLGTGAILYRLLAKRGFAIATGILHLNDLDFYVAKSTGSQFVVQTAMDKISKKNFQEAQRLVEGADCLIDTGFNAGSLNLKNIALIKHALKQKKKVFSLRKKHEADSLFGKDSKAVIPCLNNTEAVKKVEDLLKKKGKGEVM